MEEAGIYYVKGDIIPIQIIVTQRLSEKENLWLKSLTNNLTETEKAKRLIEDYLDNKKNNLYHSVMETIIHANKKTFKEVNGMSDIIMEIVQEKFDRKLNEELGKATEQVTQQVTEQVTQRTRLLDCIALVKKKCAKDKTLPIIADELESEPDELSFVYDTIIRNPEKTVEEIYELVAE